MNSSLTFFLAALFTLSISDKNSESSSSKTFAIDLKFFLISSSSIDLSKTGKCLGLQLI